MFFRSFQLPLEYIISHPIPLKIIMGALVLGKPWGWWYLTGFKTLDTKVGVPLEQGITDCSERIS